MTTYLFIYSFEERVVTFTTNTFKEALLDFATYTGNKGEIFIKALRGFEENDIKGMIQLLNDLCGESIDYVYTIKEVLYCG